MDQHKAVPVTRPFKLFEHSLNQFNDVVIPHRLDMMKKHRLNIEKSIQSGDFCCAMKEQASIKILVQNLKRDLSEIEALRNQVNVQDLSQFDKATEKSRLRAIEAMKESISMNDRLLSESRRKKESSEESVAAVPIQDIPHLQILESNRPLLNKNEEEYVRAWENLREDIEGLHSMYVDLHSMTEAQREIVDSVENNVTSTAESVHQGNQNLKKALMYKGSVYPVVGAALGTVIGGPVGLVIGLKAGGCLAIGGGVLGYLGGKILKNSHGGKVEDTDKHPVPQEISPDKPHQN